MNTRKYHLDGKAGLVVRRRSRVTGEVNAIYNATQAGMDPCGGPWVTVCETHGTLANHRTLELARDHLTTGIWCEQCHGVPSHDPAICALCGRSITNFRFVRKDGDHLADGYFQPHLSAAELDRLPDGESTVCEDRKQCKAAQVHGN